MKILVTGAGALLGQGIIKSLMNSTFDDIRIIAADPSPLSAGLYWTDEHYLLPMAKDPSYLGALMRLVEKTRPDVLIPGTDVELMTLSLNREKIETLYGVKVLISSPKVIEIADDKYNTYEFFRSHGFDCPDSCLPGEEAELLDRCGFPLIVKPRVGARAIGVRKVYNLKELKSAIMETENPVIQECVGEDGLEYTAGVICFNDACQASIVMRRDLRDGNSYRVYVEKSEALHHEVVAFAQKLNPYGPANFQFRIGDGNVKVFEINGRFSGTTPLRMLAGFNEVEMCIRHLLYGEPVVQPEIRDVVILRHWSETVVSQDMINKVGRGE